MRGRGIVWILLSFAAIAGGVHLNFPGFIKGVPPGAMNLFVTLGYLGAWVLVLVAGIRRGRRGILRYGLVLWVATLLTVLAFAYAQAAGISLYGALPAWVLLVSPLYGVRFFAGCDPTGMVALAVVSVLMSLLFAAPLRRGLGR